MRCVILLATVVSLVFALADCTAPAPTPAKTPIRWFVGLDYSASFTQMKALKMVVASFKAGSYNLFAPQFPLGSCPDPVRPLS